VKAKNREATVPPAIVAADNKGKQPISPQAKRGTGMVCRRQVVPVPFLRSMFGLLFFPAHAGFRQKEGLGSFCRRQVVPVPFLHSVFVTPDSDPGSIFISHILYLIFCVPFPPLASCTGTTCRALCHPDRRPPCGRSRGIYSLLTSASCRFLCPSRASGIQYLCSFIFYF
jgi:hypothetical protein